MKAIIPTGGRGTRMRPITFSSNKHFIPVANKPLILYPLEAVLKAGIKEIAITYNPGGLEQAQQFLGDGSQRGVKITYILQKNPTGGVADIARVCEEYLAGDTFVFHLGDNIFLNGIRQAVDYFNTHKPNGLVTMIHHKDNRRLGVPYFNEQGRLIQYVEKPENPPHDFAIPGLYLGDPNFFKAFKEDPVQPSARGEYEISAPYQWLIDHGYRVDVIEYKGKWLDPGKFDDWLETNRYILDEKLEAKVESELGQGAVVEGRVKIGKDCVIENSQIRGPVIIGNNVTLKNSYVGPFSSISDDCTIESSHIENSVVMNKAKIQNVDRPIDTSIIGVESELKKHSGPASFMKLFIGEKSNIEI